MRPAPLPLGFSQSVKSGDTIDVRVIGARSSRFGDLYHRLIRLSWLRFSLGFVLMFFAFNLGFAALYTLDPGGLSAAQSDPFPQFWHAFFFSVHTVATIGYGNCFPVRRLRVPPLPRPAVPA